jgi:drug/metabolite transporter (DMT)-like permease
MRRLQGVGLAAFCVLAGSRWLVDNAFPSTLPPLLEQCFHSAIICAVALVLWIFRSPQILAKADSNWLKVVLAGVMLLGLPALLQAFGHGLAEANGAALFALAPLFVVVGAASYEMPAGGRGLMMPALIGLAGALLLLPFQLPSSPQGAVWFAAILVVVMLGAGASVWLYGLLQSGSIALNVAFLCAGNTLVLGGFALFRGELHVSLSTLPLELLRCILLVQPQIFLLVWLLRELRPARLSARYLIAPLLTAVEGVIFLHPVLDLRICAGMLLMAGGSAGLLLWKEEDETAGTKLRLG